jgi:hypothetical protein
MKLDRLNGTAHCATQAVPRASLPPAEVQQSPPGGLEVCRVCAPPMSSKAANRAPRKQPASDPAVRQVESAPRPSLSRDRGRTHLLGDDPVKQQPIAQRREFTPDGDEFEVPWAVTGVAV